MKIETEVKILVRSLLKAGLSRTDIISELKVCDQTLYRWEQGKKIPKPSYVRDLQRMLREGKKD